MDLERRQAQPKLLNNIGEKISKAIENLLKAQQFAMSTRPKVGGFPYLAEALRKAGITRNIWTLPACHSVYLSPSYVKNENLFIEDCYDNSIYYDLSANGLPNLPNELGIGFINGVWNNFKSAKGGAEWRRDFVPRLDRAGAKREKEVLVKNWGESPT